MNELESEQDKVWYLVCTNYVEEEFHHLSMEELRELLEAEWEHDFNGLIIGRDVDCVGRLCAFFRGESAHVLYEDFDSIYWRCTCDLAACDRQDWDKMVRLTPNDTQEYSFCKCYIIPKARAWEIVDRYLSTGSLEGLFLLKADGKAQI